MFSALQERPRNPSRFAAVAVFLLTLAGASAAQAAEACTPGKTGRIAFMLKQQTAFRYLNADVPFFKKTAEAAGYKVLVQSAENDASAQMAQAENILTQGVDAIVIQPVDFHVVSQLPVGPTGKVRRRELLQRNLAAL